jgi:hypothetical protein
MDVSPCLTASSKSGLLSGVSRVNRTWQLDRHCDALAWIERVVAKPIDRATESVGCSDY